MSSRDHTFSATDAEANQTRAVRGSSVLLVGRALSTALGAVTIQVLIVRYLSKADYGAFAYGLSIATLISGFASLGLSRAVPRFIPMYEERDESDKVVGSIILSVGLTLLIGGVAVLAVFLLRTPLAAVVIRDDLTVAVLVILIGMAPLQALDDLLDNLTVLFSGVRSVFLRKYVLAPLLRLSAVVTVIVLGVGVRALAWGYVAAALLGVAAYGALLQRELRRRGMFARLRMAVRAMPVRELLTFSVPLLTTNLVGTLLNASDVVLLGYFRGPEEVAALRAVVPFGRFNQFVLLSFSLLFTPLAARLLSRGEHQAIGKLYWQTAAWVCVLSLPVLVLTFVLADPLTVTLIGERYADSASLLAILSLGFFLQAALGPNGLLLAINGNIGVLAAVNAAAVVVNLVANVIMIPLLGATGAALATTGTLVVHNILKQLMMSRRLGIPARPGQYGVVYATSALAVALLWVLEQWGDPPFVVAVVAGGGVCLAVLYATRRRLAIADTFPELARLPLVRHLVA